MSFRSETVPPPDPNGIFLPLAGGTMRGSISVQTDNAIDLGSSANRWRIPSIIWLLHPAQPSSSSR
jgi:hypothetical protein